MRRTIMTAFSMLSLSTLLAWGWSDAARAQTGTTATGASRAMNPSLSLNGTFVAGWEDHRREGEQYTHIHVQEIELAAMSIVDPYFKASIFTSFGPPHTHGDEEQVEADEHVHGDQIAVEEAFVRTLSLPAGWGIRAGKMLIPFGRLNTIHLHHLPFIEAPYGFHELIGPHGVSDVGAELSCAPPAPWYINLCLFAGDGTDALFDAHEAAFAFAGRWENLWDLGEAATFELGASIMTGPAPGGTSRTFYGADTRFKWRDQRKTYGGALEWMAELLVDAPEEGRDQYAVASYARYRFARTWWVGAGYSRFDDATDARAGNEVKIQLALTPSEYSALRLDTSYLDLPEVGRIWKVQLQLNFTIGSHPAHIY